MVDFEDERQLTKWANTVYDIVGAAIEVHRTLGFGLSESVYEESLGIELGEAGYEYMTQCCWINILGWTWLLRML